MASFTSGKFLFFTSFVAVVLVSYLVLQPLLVKRTYTYELRFTFHGVEAKELWDHFSDFGRLMKSNPTVIEYKILHSTRNTKDAFEYSVFYREYLVNTPFLTNEAIGNFSLGVTAAESTPARAVYWINSTHITYQTGAAFHSTDKMAFTQGTEPKSANLEQIITVECPILLAYPCKHELISQRTLILQELSREFVFTVKFMEHIL